MKLGSFRRLLSSDFKPDDKPLIDQISNTYNPNIEAVYQALDKKIDFQNNIQSTIVTFQVTVDATGRPVRPTTVRLDPSQAQVPINGCFPLSARGASNPSLLPLAGVYVDINRVDSTVVSIQFVKGLEPSQAYNITVLIL